MISNRNYALDLMKVLAVLFITNSHFIPLYKDINPSFATFGVQGNALFFFVSGYLMMGGLMRRNSSSNFSAWMVKKVRRLCPPVWLCVVAVSIMFNASIRWQNLVLADQYWFVQCIFVYYALCYPLFKVQSQIGGGKLLWSVFVVVNLLSCFWMFVMPKTLGSIYHTNLHYIYHLGLMVFGGIVYMTHILKRPRKLWIDGILALSSFALYFVIMKFGKGQMGKMYYVQMLGLIPLYGFVYYLFRTLSSSVFTRFVANKTVKPVVLFISDLTLEIYIVQQYVITDKFNSLFPFNTVVVFLIIVLFAYMLHLMVVLFQNVMCGKPLITKNFLEI